MSEDKKRLLQVAKEFNVGLSTITVYLLKKGIEIPDDDPNAKITSDNYALLQKHFGSDKAEKQKISQMKENLKEIKESQKNSAKQHITEEHNTSPISVDELRNSTKKDGRTPLKPLKGDGKTKKLSFDSSPKITAKKSDSESLNQLPEAESLVSEENHPQVIPVLTPVMESVSLPAETTVVSPQELTSVSSVSSEEKEIREADQEKLQAEKNQRELERRRQKEKDKKLKAKTEKIEKEKELARLEVQKKEVLPTPDLVETPVVVSAEITPAITDSPAEDEQNVIRAKDHSPKLTGLKVLGKIELTPPPSKKDKDKDKKDQTPQTVADGDDKKRKRKRKRKTDAPATNTPP